MAARRVLLSYLDHNKIFSIPADVTCDVSYIKDKFLTSFDLKDDLTVDVLLQRYDKDWEAFVDLSTEDKLSDKDKVKAIVTYELSVKKPFGSSSNTSAAASIVSLY